MTVYFILTQRCLMLLPEEEEDWLPKEHSWKSLCTRSNKGPCVVF